MTIEYAGPYNEQAACAFLLLTLRPPYTTLRMPGRIMTEYSKGKLYTDDCPDYDTVITRSNSTANSYSTSRSVHWSGSDASSTAVTSPLNIHRKGSQSVSNVALSRERYVYTYNLVAGSTPLSFFISVEPCHGRPTVGDYMFTLSMKCNGVSRELCEPQSLHLTVDPRALDFAVFVFPGKSSIPVGALWSLRVWLRVNGVDHRVFSDDELWVGKDLDFNSISDASFVRLKKIESKYQVYHGYVGRALVTFIVRWQRVNDTTYRYSLDYEASGVGANLFDDLKVQVDGDPRTVTFLIYSVPMTSTPAGSSHRLRVWLKSLVSFPVHTDPGSSYPIPFNDSFIYQRIWKMDLFKIGAHLDFESMSNKAVMGFSAGPVQTITTSTASTSQRMRIPDEKRQRGYH